MQKHEDNLTSQLDGGALVPLSGVTVSVTSDATGLAASLYSDNGVTPITGHIVSDDLGYYSFSAPNGEYTLTYTSPRIKTFTRKVILADPSDNPYATLSQLAAPSGASNVGNGTETIADSLNALQLADYVALRAYNGPRRSVYVTGYLGTAAPSGIAGMFVRRDDLNPATTTENGGTRIVGAAVWDRVTGSNMTSTAWFQIVGDGTTETAKWQAAINAISASGGGILRADPGKVYVTGKLTPKSNVLIDLNGSTLKLANGTNAPILYDNGAGNGTRFGVINGTLDCNMVNNSGVNVVGGVWLTNWTYLTFSDLAITNCFRVGLYLNAARYVSIRNYSFTNSGVSGSGYFAYALSLEDAGGVRSQFVTIENVSVSNVYGFGIHFYRIDDFTARNLKFDTLTYSTHLAIAITLTEATRGSVTNISCNAVDGDNIEINDSSDIELTHTNVTAAGNRALLMGQNTAPNYNHRIKVKSFTATATLSATNGMSGVACALSYCIDCDFERLDMDLGCNVSSGATLSSNNRMRDSVFGTTAQNGLVSLGFFTLDRVRFSDYTYRYLGKQKAIVSLSTTLANTTGVYNIDPAAMLPGIFSGYGFAAGTLRTVSYLSGSANQASLQKVDFFICTVGGTKAANLSTVTTVASSISRALTIAGDTTANAIIKLTNATAVDLKVAIDIEFTTYI
jgi:hypothetical protein